MNDAAAPSLKSLIRDLRDNVVVLEGGGSIGAGLWVSKDGLIVTNRHVVGGQKVMMAGFADETQSKAICFHQHLSSDLSLLRTNKPRVSPFNFSKRSSDSAEVGEEVFAIGHPRGLRFTATRGIVSSPVRTLNGERFIQTDVAINPGNSGGPVFDFQGRLVGLATMIYRDSDGLGFAIPAVDVVEYLNDVVAQIRNKRVSYPNNADFDNLAVSSNPIQTARAGVEALGWKYRTSESRGNTYFTIYAPGQIEVTLGVMGKTVICNSVVMPLRPSEQHDADLLWAALEAARPTAVGVSVDEDNSLIVRHSRRLDGLDAVEVEQMLIDLVDAVDHISRHVIRFVHGPM